MKKLYILFFIVIFGFLLRIYKLESRPSGFTWDEAALGYNAYSLLLTGRDEHAARFPIVFKSFGDYKPGLYVYFTVLPVKIFGLSEFSTRLPSAIFGTLLIPITYLLVKNLFSTKHLALSTALLLAINPWAVHFSRGAWEANLALFFTTLAALLFLKKRYLSSALFFSLTLWSYQGAKLFTPLFLLTLFWVYRPLIKTIFKSLSLLLLLLVPILVNFSSQSGRLKVFSVFNYTRPESQIQNILKQDKNGRYFNLFHSEAYDQIRGVTERYLNHFSPRFLFFEGDWSNPRHSTPYYGNLHIPEILTIILGFYYLFKFQNSNLKLLLLWLLLAPIPSALSRDIVSGVRSLPMLVPLVILSAFGLMSIWKSKILGFCFSLLLLLFTIYWLDLYFVHYPFYFAKHWLTPYKKAVELVNNNIHSFNRVVFTDTLGQPYIFVLFYNQTDPRLFWTRSEFIANPFGDVGGVSKFDKYVFSKVDWPAQRGDTSTIFVGNQYELPQQDMNPVNLVRLGEIYHPDGSHALRIIGLK